MPYSNFVDTEQEAEDLHFTEGDIEALLIDGNTGDARALLENLRETQPVLADVMWGEIIAKHGIAL